MAAEWTRMNADTRPPRWAEAILRRMLAPRYRETVSGDLLEDYRERVLPQRGRRAADRWYVAQVGGFVWRSVFVWAALFSASFVARNAMDWFVRTSASLPTSRNIASNSRYSSIRRYAVTERQDDARRVIRRSPW